MPPSTAAQIYSVTNGKLSMRWERSSPGTIGKVFQCVDHSRSDGISANGNGLACVGDQRQRRNKVSRNALQGVSKPNAGKQSDERRESPTRLLPRMRRQ